MPVTCKAAVAMAINEPLRTVEVTLRDPGPGEVMFRVEATGLCHSDLLVLDGQAPHVFPLVPGHEAIGHVVQVGPGVTDFAVGDRVMPFLVPDCGICRYCTSGRTNMCEQFAARRGTPHAPFTLDDQPVAAFLGLGTFAEYAVVRDDMLVRVDANAPAAETCCIGCGVTTGIGAALISAKVHPGSSVAVFGVGGVGLSVVQGARLAGASRIFAIDANIYKEHVARSMGATDFLDSSAIENVSAFLVRETGLGVDYAFECVGSPELIRQAVESTNPAWGVTVNIGLVPSGQELTIGGMGLGVGRRWTASLMGGAKRADVARYVDMFVAGTINLDRLVSHRLTLDEVNQGFDLMRNRQSSRAVMCF